MKIEIYKKNNHSYQLAYEDGRDINGFVLTFIVKSKIDNSNNDSKSLIKKTYTISGSVNGIFYLNLDSNDTNIPAGFYKYELQLSKNNGVGIPDTIITLSQDDFIVKNTLIKE